MGIASAVLMRYTRETMMHFTIELAGVPVELRHRYGFVAALCRDYLTAKPPALSVSASDAEIEAERRLCGGIHGVEVCEATCLHRAVVRALVPHGIILLHAAAVSLHGRAYVFLAKSGVGKSTHIRLWSEELGARVVNGDKPFFSFVGDALTVHGSPWRGKEGLGEPVSAPVAALCFLSRGEVNRIAPMSAADAVGRIFHQVLLPHDGAAQAAVMAFLDRTLRTVPLYSLQCTPAPEAAHVALRGMKIDDKGCMI